MNLNETLPVLINGQEKVASGLTKQTTVNDIIYAFIAKMDPSFNPTYYALFEKYEDNERILDGELKIYKIIKYWKQLGYLDKMKFVIKKRRRSIINSPNKLSVRDESRSEIEKYASVKKFNRAKRSSIISQQTRLIKLKYIDLVQKQNELIDRQIEKLNKIEAKLTESELNRLMASKVTLLQSLENELKNLESEDDELHKLQSAKTSSSSLSSALTSVSTQEPNEHHCRILSDVNFKMDDESDTGISSNNSSEDAYCLETLV
jgi:paraquat-inducible protein B